MTFIGNIATKCFIRTIDTLKIYLIFPNPNKQKRDVEFKQIDVVTWQAPKQHGPNQLHNPNPNPAPNPNQHAERGRLALPLVPQKKSSNPSLDTFWGKGEERIIPHIVSYPTLCERIVRVRVPS